MFRIIKLKSCKRCGGKLALEQDFYGVYLCCIQCGAVYEKREVWDIGRSDFKVPARAFNTHHP